MAMITINPNSLKSRFTKRFLRSFTQINKQTANSSSSSAKYLRYHRIRVAAYESMARAVGSKKAWSRAVIRNIKNKRQKGLSKTGFKIHGSQRNGSKTKSKNKHKVEINDLRRVVPGGEDMDDCRLLDETAHFIKCLKTQIQVMQSIADLKSS